VGSFRGAVPTLPLVLYTTKGAEEGALCGRVRRKSRDGSCGRELVAGFSGSGGGVFVIGEGGFGDDGEGMHVGALGGGELFAADDYAEFIGGGLSSFAAEVGGV